MKIKERLLWSPGKGHIVQSRGFRKGFVQDMSFEPQSLFPLLRCGQDELQHISFYVKLIYCFGSNARYSKCA